MAEIGNEIRSSTSRGLQKRRQVTALYMFTDTNPSLLIAPKFLFTVDENVLFLYNFNKKPTP